MRISILMADMLVLIYRYQYQQKYQLEEYIGICIVWTHIGPTLIYIKDGQILNGHTNLYYLSLRVRSLKFYCLSKKMVPKMVKVPCLLWIFLRNFNTGVEGQKQFSP
jgi:hypothetical protein